MAPPEATSAPGQVEVLQDRLLHLLRERESLRTVEADRSALERNRRAIVEAQWELSRALIARHHRSFQAA